MSVIDEIKQKTDIVEVIGQYAALKKAGRNLTALCPFHSEKHASFFVYPEQQSWHCFGACNTGGDVFSFVMKKQGIDFGEALRLLAQRANVSLPSKREGGEKEKEQRERLYKVNETAAQYFHNLLLNSPAGEKARSYVASRGILPKAIADFQLGFSLNSWEALKQHLLERGYSDSELLEAGLLVETEEGKKHDRFRNRLMFPICDVRGRVIGFGGRALDDSMPKYLNSPQTPLFDKSSNLYALNLAAAVIRQQDSAVVVEGYMDVIIAHQNGFTNVVASMGTAITDKQVSTLKRLSRNMILALDADAAGEEAMLRCIGYENILDAEIKVIILPEGKDPDDVIKEDTKVWRRLVAEALPIVDYTFNTVTAKANLKTASGKSLVADRLLPIIAEIKDNIRRDHYLQSLARLIGASYRSMEATLRGYMTKQKTPKPKQEAISHATHPLVSSPQEEYCLALLLQHPELKARVEEILPEYFENSENREIFVAWQQASDPALLKDKLDTALWEHLDSIITKAILPEGKDAANQIEKRYADCVLRLRERFLRGLEAKRAAILALEREAGGTAAELAKLKEQGIEVSIELGKVFTQESGRR